MPPETFPFSCLENSTSDQKGMNEMIREYILTTNASCNTELKSNHSSFRELLRGL